MRKFAKAFGAAVVAGAAVLTMSSASALWGGGPWGGGGGPWGGCGYNNQYGNGTGYGNTSGWGDGYGDGSGSGSGDFSMNMSGRGNTNMRGYGNGYGAGDGWGRGYNQSSPGWGGYGAGLRRLRRWLRPGLRLRCSDDGSPGSAGASSPRCQPVSADVRKNPSVIGRVFFVRNKGY